MKCKLRRLLTWLRIVVKNRRIYPWATVRHTGHNYWEFLVIKGQDVTAELSQCQDCKQIWKLMDYDPEEAS